ncbi:hypothetical protein QM012_004648 [Aureobasidium pullulans]|uniref:BHLH domain-containing protein n=1 Tax=Aureobasidium pullulans TaxID=5580 RepID=A0ABR0TTP0_AURPU
MPELSSPLIFIGQSRSNHKVKPSCSAFTSSTSPSLIEMRQNDKRFDNEMKGLRELRDSVRMLNDKICLLNDRIETKLKNYDRGGSWRRIKCNRSKPAIKILEDMIETLLKGRDASRISDLAAQQRELKLQLKLEDLKNENSVFRELLVKHKIIMSDDPDDEWICNTDSEDD